jgi:hypothetical protein
LRRVLMVENVGCIFFGYGGVPDIFETEIRTGRKRTLGLRRHDMQKFHDPMSYRFSSTKSSRCPIVMVMAGTNYNRPAICAFLDIKSNLDY